MHTFTHTHTRTKCKWVVLYVPLSDLSLLALPLVRTCRSISPLEKHMGLSVSGWNFLPGTPAALSTDHSVQQAIAGPTALVFRAPGDQTAVSAAHGGHQEGF